MPDSNPMNPQSEARSRRRTSADARALACFASIGIGIGARLVLKGLFLALGCFWYLTMAGLHIAAQAYAGSLRQESNAQVRRLSLVSNALFVCACMAQYEQLDGRGNRLIAVEIVGIIPGTDVEAMHSATKASDRLAMLWSIAVWALPATSWALLFHAGRKVRERRRKALCENCGYPLTCGGQCTECGWRTPAASQPS